MRAWIVIGLWVAAILFPISWLGTLSPASRALIDRLLEPEWLHVVMHVIFYAGLVIFVMLQRRRQGKRTTLGALIAMIIVIGAFQELFQYLTQDYWVSPFRALRSSAFDLTVDLAGGMMGLGLYQNLFDRNLDSFEPPRTK